MRRLLILLIAVVAAMLVTAPVHAAPNGGSNKANAKLCQKGGWQTVYTSTGATFSSESACSSYAAQGGKILTAPPVAATLTVSTQTSSGYCYHTVTGSGLAPLSAVAVTWQDGGDGWRPAGTVYADGAGNLSYTSGPRSFDPIRATGTAAAGDPIVSNIGYC